MLLVLDIGNTNTVIGVFDGDVLAAHWRLTSVDRTSDELGMLIQNLLHSHGFSPSDIDGAMMASVVPRQESVWIDALSSYIKVTPYSVKHGMSLGIKIELDNPDEVGADRLVNAAAAIEKYGAPVIAVDLGTAITLDVVSKDGAYIGGAIAPGLAVSMESLFSRTAKLPQIALTAPAHAIGRNTTHAIQSGIIYGYVGLVDSLVERISRELGCTPPVVATGGHANIIAENSRTITNVEPWLTLDGLLLLHRRVSWSHH